MVEAIAAERVIEPEIADLLTDLKRRLVRRFGDRFVGLYLFGSRARGEHKPDSDVDVAVVLDQTLASRNVEIRSRKHGTLVGQFSRQFIAGAACREPSAARSTTFRSFARSVTTKHLRWRAMTPTKRSRAHARLSPRSSRC